MKTLSTFLLLLSVTALSGCKSISTSHQSQFTRFVGVENFSKFSRSQNENGKTVLLSPKIKAHIPWNELIISWNADAPSGTFVKLEAAAISAGHQTKFYTIANWSPDGKTFPRTSVRGQKDDDGNVDTDTLILNQPADAAQIRITLGGTNGALPSLKFLGLSFANTKIPVAARTPHHAPCCECSGVEMIFPHAARFGPRTATGIFVFANERPRNFSTGRAPLVPPSVTRICAASAG